MTSTALRLVSRETIVGAHDHIVERPSRARTSQFIGSQIVEKT